MGRVVKDWKPVKADDMQVAPHRYLWGGAIGSDGQKLPWIENATNSRETRAAIPYREGEVIYIDRGGIAVRALIYVVLPHTRDHLGSRRESFHVQPETRDGTFSKLWERVYPGTIQRGYHKAGLAPDLDGK